MRWGASATRLFCKGGSRGKAVRKQAEGGNNASFPPSSLLPDRLPPAPSLSNKAGRHLPARNPYLRSIPHENSRPSEALAVIHTNAAGS